MILGGLVSSFALTASKEAAEPPPEPPSGKSTVYVFNIFWDNEVIVNRYDTTSTTTETTARGWFIR
jgi:hypothetical protein